MYRLVFLVSWLTFAGFISGQQTFAQRLSLDHVKPGTKLELSGQVVKINKYSFVMNSDSREYIVRPESGCQIELQLNKPFFSREHNRLFVQLVGTDDPNQRKSFELKPRNFIQVRFNHQRQMDRVMANKPIRFNNYTISDQPFEQPGKDEFALVGELVSKSGREHWQLKNKSKEFDIQLGHQKASLRGFTIHDFKPTQTKVSVTGTIRNGSLHATKIGFQPTK